MGHKGKHCLSIMHLNIRHYYNNRTELDNVILEHNPDIITLNETRFKPNTKVTHTDYNIFRHDLPTGIWGTAIFIKKYIPAIQLTLPNHFQDEDTVFCKIQFPTLTLHIATYYSSPNRQLNTDLLTFFDTKTNTIITGDFNAHHTFFQDRYDNVKGSQLINFLMQSKQQILHTPGPTRVPNIGQLPTSPDKILIRYNIHTQTQNCKILEPLNTDHCPIFFEIKTPQWIAKTKNTFRTIEDLNNADWHIFQHYITDNLQLTDIHNINELDTADKHFIDTINNAKNIAIPKKRINTTYRRTLPPNIIQTIKLKRQAHRQFMRTHTDADRRIYRQLQDDVKYLIQNYERNRFHKLTLDIDEKHVTNIQDFWRQIKRLKGDKKMTSTPLWQQNHLIFDINDKLEIFRQHLSNIHKEPEGPHFDQTHYNTVKNYILTNRLIFTPLNTPTPPLQAHPTTDPITIEDIHNALHRKRSTAPGQDKITYHLLKKLPNTAIHFLSNLYTASLYLGYVPKRWKHTHKHKHTHTHTHTYTNTSS